MQVRVSFFQFRRSKLTLRGKEMLMLILKVNKVFGSAFQSLVFERMQLEHTNLIAAPHDILNEHVWVSFSIVCLREVVSDAA